MSEPKRWTLHEGGSDWDETRNTDYIAGPPFEDGEEVMPVSEHENLLKIVRCAVDLWDEAHETDNSIALGAAFVGLRKALGDSLAVPPVPGAEDYEAAMDALVPFVHTGVIQGNPEELELIAHAVLDRMTPAEVVRMIDEEREAHHRMLDAWERDIEARAGENSDA